MEKVTHLVLITDTSRKGTQVVQTIRKVADELVNSTKQAGVIINRVPDESIVQYMDLGDLPVLSVIPSDSSLAEFDLKGAKVYSTCQMMQQLSGSKRSIEEAGDTVAVKFWRLKAKRKRDERFKAFVFFW